MMPKGGGPVRAEQLATVTRLSHQLFTSDEIGRLLDNLEGYEASLPAESDEASLIRVSRRDWQKARKVSPELAAEIARAGAAGYQSWVKARAANDFKSFLPFLETMIELKRRYVECFPDVAEPYDALLDDYEQGLTAAEVRTVFDRVRDGLVPLVRLVTERAGAVDGSPMRGHFPADDQKRLALKVIERWGFNPDSWRLDPTAHPFASSMATQDIRITTRYDDAYLGTSFFGTLHETGHGLYEHGVSPTLERTPLCRGVSLGLHESQSRMWENLVGRGRPFWRFAYPLALEVFPEHFGKYDEEAVYRSVNKMGPSLIRVEADELTYSLHIIMRFEIEQQLFNGTLKASELPEVWNAKVNEYLGIDVPSDAKGVLQDVHWSEGLLGYFPTYALGTIIASQIWERIQREIPDLDQQMASGEFGALRGWLVEHLHRYGRKFTPKETIAMVAGGPIDPEPYLRYLTSKVTSLYGDPA
jgi:carboxypeptidase Taq